MLINETVKSTMTAHLIDLRNILLIRGIRFFSQPGIFLRRSHENH